MSVYIEKREVIQCPCISRSINQCIVFMHACLGRATVAVSWNKESANWKWFNDCWRSCSV